MFDRLHKPLAVLIGSQAVCLLAGVWLYGALVTATTQWKCEQQGRAKLAETLGRLEKAGRETGGETAPSTSVSGLVRALSQVQPDAPIRWLLTDETWRIVAASKARPQSDERVWESPGATLRWMAEIGFASDEGLEQGMLHLENGASYPAALLPLEGGRWRLITVWELSSFVPAAAPGGQSLATSAISVLWTIMLQAVVAFLVLKQIGRRHDRRDAEVTHGMHRQAQSLVRTRDAIIIGLAKLAESRDSDTGQHLERISRYATRLASALRTEPGFCRQVTPEFVRLIGISSALHDIGKVGISDDVLHKKGPLTKQERQEIERHTILGAECLTHIDQRLGDSGFLTMAREIALSHHEHWDGGGYPNQLQGEQIPLAARIVALVDVYDALASKRPYKASLPHSECVEYIRRQAGKHFDPRLVEVFLRLESYFLKIRVAQAPPVVDPLEAKGDSKDPMGAEKTTVPAAPESPRRRPTVLKTATGPAKIHH